MNKFFSSCLLLMLVCVLKGQELKLKYGDIDKSDFEVADFKGDSSMSAIILADLGSSKIQYDGTRGWFLLFEKHTRIKILSTEGYNFADVEIALYHNGESGEDLSSFKATTYNLDGGKLKESRTKKKESFDEKIDENWDRVKYTLPDVKVGSIIEIKYAIRSDYFFNLRDWYFQYDVPALWTEYNVSIPEYFVYEKIMQGFQPFVINEESRSTEQIATSIKQQSGRSGLETGSGSYRAARYEYESRTYHWAAENVPSFKAEPYMTSRNNYLSKVEFELASTNFPESPVRRYMGTWSGINLSFLRNDNFGGRLGGSNFLKSDVERLTASASSELEKVSAIYYFVKSNVEWNGEFRKYADGSFKNVLQEGKGSSADINLLLANMLLKAGINAKPVLISTRNNGFIKIQFPLSKQFNYVILKVEIAGKEVFLDATDRSLPINLIPLRAINQRGLVIDDQESGWVNVMASGLFSTVISADLTLTENGELKGKLLTNYSDYTARSKRIELFGVEDIDSKEEERMGWVINDVKVQNLDNPNKPLSIMYDFSTTKGVEVLGDLIYLNPFIIGQTEENPFKLEQRAYPVDFVAPQRFNYVCTIKIPDGYVFDEVPKKSSVALPNSAGVLRYIVGVKDDVLTISMKLNIQQSLFTSIDYPALRSFFSQIVEKEGQQIILKKKT